MPKKLTRTQIKRLVALRQAEEPVTIAHLAVRFGVSERTIYYYLALWREAGGHV